MNKALIFRMVCIALLWLALCYIVLTSGPITFMTIFIVIASGIIVFVPLYKKHLKDLRKND